MFCAISGEPPKEPVVSTKSGAIFEKRLIEAYIKENGFDPVNQEKCTSNDLITVKGSPIVTPKPPEAASLPSLLSMMQSEWDALAIESFNLRKQLIETRQALSTSLYQYDGACRVIARLIKERDEARNAIKELALDTRSEPNDVCEVGMQIEATQEKLIGQRKKRKVAITPEQVNDLQKLALKQISNLDLKSAQPCAYSAHLHVLFIINQLVDLDNNQNVSINTAPANCAVFCKEMLILGLQDGYISILNKDGQQKSLIQVDDAPIALIAAHPVLDVVFVCLQSKQWQLRDFSKLVLQGELPTTPVDCAFHPDGHLIAVSLDNGSIVFLNAITGITEATLGCTNIQEVLKFSENGYWMASGAANGTILIWDLRKATIVHQISVGVGLCSLDWDTSGQFIAACSEQTVKIVFYEKATKSFQIIHEILSEAKLQSVFWQSQTRLFCCLGRHGEIYNSV